MKRILVLLILVVSLSLPAWAVGTHSSTDSLLGTYTPCGLLQSPSLSSPSLSDGSSDSLDTSYIPNWAKVIEERLSYKVSFNVSRFTLEEVVDVLRQSLKVNIILSPNATECDTKMNLDIKGMRGALALNWCCRLANAGWLIRDEAIFVYHESEVEKVETEEPDIEEILDLIEEHGYHPPDFIPRHDPFGRDDYEYE